MHPSSQSLSSYTDHALQAHQSAKEARQAQRAISGDKIQSLNQLLQWSTANSAITPTTNNDNMNVDTSSHRKLTQDNATKTDQQLRKDREWLDVAFPDIYEGIRQLVADLDSPSSDVQLAALESLQEFFLDLNYATNIDKVGALDPVLRLCDADDDDVRAAAIWVAGTAMKDLPEVKNVFLSRDVHHMLARRLTDTSGPVRAKAVMAASALLRHADEGTIRQFDSAGASAALRANLADSNVQTRRRARFFLQHAPETGNASFVSALLSDRPAVAAFSASLAELEPDDVADVEAAIGALNVLVDEDLPGLMQVSPELPGILDELAAQCSDDDLVSIIRQASARLA